MAQFSAAISPYVPVTSPPPSSTTSEYMVIIYMWPLLSSIDNLRMSLKTLIFVKSVKILLQEQFT